MADLTRRFLRTRPQGSRSGELTDGWVAAMAGNWATSAKIVRAKISPHRFLEPKAFPDDLHNEDSDAWCHGVLPAAHASPHRTRNPSERLYARASSVGATPFSCLPCHRRLWFLGLNHTQAHRETIVRCDDNSHLMILMEIVPGLILAAMDSEDRVGRRSVAFM
jgi:hypothetical protein